MVRVLLTACDKRHLHGPGITYLQSPEGLELLSKRGIPKPWTVICGTQAERSDWENLISNTFNGSANKFQDLIHPEIWIHSEVKKDSNITGPLIIDTVVAKAFFDKKWIQDLIKDTADLIILDLKPVEHVPDHLLSFHKVMLGKFISQAAWNNLEPYLGADVTFYQVSQLASGFYSTTFTGKPDAVMTPTSTSTMKDPVDETKTAKGSTPSKSPPKPSHSLTAEQRSKLEGKDPSLSAVYLQLWCPDQGRQQSQQYDTSEIINYMKQVVSETVHQSILTHVISVPIQEPGSVIIGLQMPLNKKDLICLLLMNEIDRMKTPQTDDQGRVIQPQLVTQAAILF